MSHSTSEKEETPKCENCYYAYRGGVGRSISRMFCHRYPPQRNGFPEVIPDTWCGEWKEENEDTSSG